MEKLEVFHKPVLLKEVVEFLRVREGEKYIDATVGGGGHTLAILKRGGKVLGIDCDPKAIEYVKERLKFEIGSNIVLVQDNFAHLKKIAKREGFERVGGVLFDLGVSLYQLKTPERGFSFESDFPLDMRMDPSLEITAEDLVNSLGKEELYEIFSKFGEERHAFRVAETIVRARALKPIKTCRQLSELILKAGGKRDRCFQALRIVVNGELENLKTALCQSVDLLKPKGRLVVISFHSLEDRIVKNFFQKTEKIKVLTKRPIRPTEEEIKRNPRSRSAKMRVGEKQ